MHVNDIEGNINAKVSNGYNRHLNRYTNTQITIYMQQLIVSANHKQAE